MVLLWILFQLIYARIVENEVFQGTDDFFC